MKKKETPQRTLTIMIGNIGSGKSTLAKELLKGSPNTMYVNDDAITAMLNQDYGDNHFSPRHRNVYEQLLYDCVNVALSAGFNVILDSGYFCISKDRRRQYLKLAEMWNAKVVAYVVTSEGGLDRRIAQDPSAGKTDWNAVYGMMQRDYTEPTTAEGFTEIFHVENNITCD